MPALIMSMLIIVSAVAFAMLGGISYDATGPTVQANAMGVQSAWLQVQSFASMCAAGYPSGNNGTGVGYIAYPATPAGTTLTCPGSGSTLPLPTGWTYTNNVSGVIATVAVPAQVGPTVAAATGGTYAAGTLTLHIR